MQNTEIYILMLNICYIMLYMTTTGKFEKENRKKQNIKQATQSISQRNVSSTPKGLQLARPLS